MTLTPGSTVTLRVKTVPATAKARKTIERLMRLNPKAQRTLDKVAKDAKQLREHGFPASDPRLVFSVREPFPSKWSQAEMVFGQVQVDEPLRIRSLMPENGVIFSDGIEADALDFRVGMEATIGVDPKRGRLLL